MYIYIYIYNLKDNIRENVSMSNEKIWSINLSKIFNWLKYSQHLIIYLNKINNPNLNIKICYIYNRKLRINNIIEVILTLMNK
jgi:hypothetical protein